MPTIILPPYPYIYYIVLNGKLIVGDHSHELAMEKIKCRRRQFNCRRSVINCRRPSITLLGAEKLIVGTPQINCRHPFYNCRPPPFTSVRAGVPNRTFGAAEFAARGTLGGQVGPAATLRGAKVPPGAMSS